jgi:HEAT repeat protein
MREEAIAALGGIRSASAYSALVHQTAEYPGDIRHAALAALGAQHDPRAFNFLLNVMKTSDSSSDRINAVEALGIYGNARAIPALLERVKIAPYDRINCLLSIGKLGDPGFNALCDLLKHSDGDVQFDTAIAIARCGKRAIKPLQELANSPDHSIAYSARRDLVTLRRLYR